MKNKLLFLITMLLSGALFAQTSKTNNTQGTIIQGPGHIDRTFVFTSGDLGGCTSLTKVTVDLNLALGNSNSPCTDLGTFGVHEDLNVRLVSPTGTTIDLIQDRWGYWEGSLQNPFSFNSFPPVDATVNLDDDHPTNINSLNALQSGNFSPHDALSAFAGEDPTGTWTLRISDGNSQFLPNDFICFKTATVNIFCGAAATPPTVAITSSTNITCNGASTGSITATISDGTPNYSYEWSNGSSTINTSSTTNTISSLPAGFYEVIVTDDNGLKDTTNITLTQPTALAVSVVIDSNASCNGFSDGGATASVSGGTPPYTYSWNNTATTASITGVTANTYSVTITDANGCTASNSGTVTEPTALVASVVIDSNVSCNGFSDGGATASASGGTPPYTYSWNNAATTASITGVTANTYSVTITDANGCTASNSGTVTEPTALVASVVIDSNVSCNGFSDGGATASASGGTPPYSYSWNNTATTASITGVTANTYSVTITDANGCTASNSGTITQPTAFTVSVVIDSNETCGGQNDGGATASASGGTPPYTYLWSNTATTASITGVSANTYSVTVTDANGCTTSNSNTITQTTTINVSVVIDSNASCNGYSDGGATASVSGGTPPYTYVWNNAATTASITGVTANTYSVTVTDVNGCSASNSGTITEPTALVASVVIDSNASCNGYSDGGATASATGGTPPYTYVWNNAATTASITGVTANTYSVTITDANGCTASNSGTITEPTALVAMVVIDSNASCNGFADGGATASATGGTPPYTYVWNNAATTASITGVTANTYSVTITDANGCTASNSGTITQPTALVASVVIDSNASCNGFADGGATASVTGGTPPYNYVWNNAATTASITGVTANTYSVTITDANGCTASNSGTITQPTALVASVVIDSNASCNGFADGGATASATGGTPPYTYVWNNAATTASITGVTANTYSVTITDANGCTASNSGTITQPTALVASVVIDSNASCNGYSDGGATASASGGTPPYTYSWSNSATTASITGVTANTYTVTITDANGCTASNSGTVTEPTALVAMVVIDSNVSCNGYSDGGATAGATGGTPPYTYVWNNAATTASITGVTANTYSVTVTDANGCTASNSGTVTEPALLTATVVIDSNVSCNGFADGGATASVSGGTPPYTYLWSTAATTQSITGMVANTYTVYITDANGCTTMNSNTITEPSALSVLVVIDSNASCNGFADGGATAMVMGGTPPYTYSWNNSATTASITGVTASTYSVTITDANGCTASNSGTVTEPTAVIASVVVDSNASCSGLADGGLSSAASGGTPPYTYFWSNGATTASITGVPAGTYTVYITDNNGCTASNSGTVTEPAPLGYVDTIYATDSYEWIDGITYTETTYGPTHTLTSVVTGCDSIITLNLTIINYCASRSTRNRFEWIKEVALGDDIDNLTGKNSGGYGDYTDQVLVVDTNEVVTVELTPGYRRRVYTEYWRIWADWNYDGDFDDPGEKVFEESGKNVRTGSFTVPVNVNTHDLGLRVSMRWRRYPASCGNFSSGEVEDYTIRVNGAQGYLNPIPVRLENDATVSDEYVYEFIDLYPNPVTQGEYVTGFVRVEETGVKQLQIVNTLGQVVKSTSIDCDEEESRFEISTRGLAKGLYFVNIESGSETIKIIVK